MLLNKNSMIYQADETMQPGQVFFSNRFMSFIQPMKLLSEMLYTVKCRYNAVFGVQEIDRVIAVTAL